MLSLLAGTLELRPYVFGFLLAFLLIAGRDLGRRGALVWLAVGFSVAFMAEYSSTRIGFPFGLYAYSGTTRDRELFVSNVPFFDPLSFPFLAYASWCLARLALGRPRGFAVVTLAGALMMLADVVIDPLAVRGGRWFLGHVFSYPAGGAYFGVPISNFAGWWLVGSAIVGSFLVLGSTERVDAPGTGVGLYYAVLSFNFLLTAWIGEPVLLMAGLLLHGVAAWALWACARARRNAWSQQGRSPLRTSPAPEACGP
jgi:putative membrane protein